jgi:hypothetical protein
MITWIGRFGSLSSSSRLSSAGSERPPSGSSLPMPSVRTSTELTRPACHPSCTVSYAAASVSYRPVSPFCFGWMPPIFCSRSPRVLASGPIGAISRQSLPPPRLVEKTHTPTAQSSPKSPRPRRAASLVTSMRLAPPALGTGPRIVPEMSKTASIRDGAVTAVQVESARSTTVVSGAPPLPAAAGDPAFAGPPEGTENPAPPEPSGPRRPSAPSRSRNPDPLSALCSDSAAAVLSGSVPGITAYG